MTLTETRPVHDRAEPSASTGPTTGPTTLPAARGPLSDAVRRLLTGDGSPADVLSLARSAPRTGLVRDEDVQLALLWLYELHYRGHDDTGDAWEWDPEVLAARGTLERSFEAELRELVQVPRTAPQDVASALFDLTADDGKPALAWHLARTADLGQVRELLMHRSVYHLREADAHTWAIPRLGGPAKAALLEIQIDEYGGGRHDRMHSSLFARAMRALGVDDRYGAHVGRVGATTLAGVNALSMFGLHRRLLGAVVGHLAAFEMTSSRPNQLAARGLRRLGLGPDATAFFDEHVEADAVHEQIAAHDLAGRFCRDHPERTDDVMFGAAAVLALDELAAGHLLDAWRDGRSALRD